MSTLLRINDMKDGIPIHATSVTAREVRRHGERAEEEVPCPGCGIDLTGQPINRGGVACPGCGKRHHLLIGEGQLSG